MFIELARELHVPAPASRSLALSERIYQFSKAHQAINAQEIKIVNSRVYCSISNERLIVNFRRATFSNSLFKNTLFKHFSHNLTELVLAKRVMDG